MSDFHISARPATRVAMLCLCLGIVASAQTAETNSAPATAAVPRSVFSPDLKNAKDPFFPNSNRRGERAPVRFEVIKPPPALVEQLTLNGLLSSRLAIINTKSFAENEEGYVEIDGGRRIRIRCHKINLGGNSVEITIEGDPEPKVLRLRETMQH
jgi:hypothetical protein